MSRKYMRNNANIFFSRCLFLCVFLLMLSYTNDGFAQGEYFNFTLQGSFQRSYDENAAFVKSTIGAEISIPLSNILEVSLSHSLSSQTKKYTSKYREMILATYQKYGLTNFPENLESHEEIVDTALDSGIGYSFGYFRPSLFGGLLWRTDCSEDILQDNGCIKEKMTWNAGVAMAIYMTRSLRLRLSYRVSPSLRIDNEKTTDDLTSIGITWGY